MTSNVVRLQQFLTAYFDVDELRTLALTLQLNYEDLGGDQRLSARAREMVFAIGRQQRWPELLAALQAERPKAFAEAHFSLSPPFSEKLREEFATLQPESKPVTPPIIQQKAGNKAVQIGQNFGQVVVQHPSTQILLLIVLGSVLLLVFSGLVWTFFAPDFNRSPVLEPAEEATPTFASPVRRQLEAMVLPALANTHLVDVAAQGGVVWFGAQEGLFVWRQGEPDARRVVEGAVTAVAAHTTVTAQTPESVWFALTGDDGPQFGLYRLDSDQVEWLTADVPLATAVYITAIASGDPDLVWLGDSAGNIYRYHIDTKEGRLLPAPATLPVIEVYSLATAPGETDTLWVVGSNAIYRWQGDQWVTAVPGDDIASGIINGVAGGVGQRAWFGHAAGLTLFQDRLNVNIRQECAVPALPSSLITDLATVKEGQELWLVSRGGLAWLDARTEATVPDNCAAWQWQTWTEDGFWQTATAPGVYRLAVDEKAGGETVVWVIRQGTGRVRWLPGSDRQ